MIPEIFHFLFHRRPWPEIDVIISSLDNEPDKWREGFYSDELCGPLNIRLRNALNYRSLGLRLARDGRPISIPLFCGLSEAVDRWDRHREETTKRRLLQDDHSARVQRIAEMRVALHREENAHIHSQLKDS